VAVANPLLVCCAIVLLTFFFDLLEMSFGQILWFMRTLRFWLYFLLHLILSGLAALLLFKQIDTWYLLALLSTALGVGVISNTNVKIAGFSLLPIADQFVSIKAKMFEQAANERKEEVSKAQLAERLQKLPLAKVEEAYRAGMLAVWKDAEKVKVRMEMARTKASRDIDYQSLLVGQLINSSKTFVESRIGDWEK
jgi:hypothetical protein